MATLAEIRNGIKTRLATISGLRAFDKQPSSIVTPAAWPRLSGGEYHLTMGANGGNGLVRLEVVVAVQKATVELGDEAVEPYVSRTGANSIRAAIEGDKTLGGVVDTLTVTEWAVDDEIAVAGIPYAGAVFQVEVFDNA